MRVLVTGANGQLGTDLLAALSGEVPAGGLAGDVRTGRLGRRSAVHAIGTDLPDLDITRRDAVLEACSEIRPDVIIHAAAFTAVDRCESEPDVAFAVNALGTRHVAEAARQVGARLIYISTDYVFDGTAPDAYCEWDRTNPQSVYGRSKYGGELETGPDDTVVRTSWVCGAAGANMVKTVLRLAADPGPLRFVDDQRGCPTFTADLAGALVTLADEGRPGVFHLTNHGVTTWYEFARAVMGAAGEDPGRVAPISTAELDPPRPAPRPANSALDNRAWRLAGLPELPDWQDALTRLVAALGAQGADR